MSRLPNTGSIFIVSHAAIQPLKNYQGFYIVSKIAKYYKERKRVTLINTSANSIQNMSNNFYSVNSS